MEGRIESVFWPDSIVARLHILLPLAAVSGLWLLIDPGLMLALEK
jgi:hypothetical protein